MTDFCLIQHLDRVFCRERLITAYTKNYGQGVADLEGPQQGQGQPVGANGEHFYENPTVATLFGGQTGIEAVEKTLAQYGTAANAPGWLKPYFNQLEAEFGESATGSGTLLIGLGGSGIDCNNQQIVGAPGVSGNVYQYMQLDAALKTFETIYANAVQEGQAAKMAYFNASPPPPGADYGLSTDSQNYVV